MKTVITTADKEQQIYTDQNLKQHQKANTY
jgi:hypothetical protein